MNITMKSKKIYKAVVIGTGRIGFLFQYDKKREQPASHSNALYKNKNIEIVAGCDSNAERLRKWGRVYKNARTFSDYKKLLDEVDFDIVVIAVNESSHVEVALETIKKRPGLIILEKPIASFLEEAQIIYDKAEELNVPVLVNHERRYSLDYIKARELIANGEIGDVYSVHASLWSGVAVWDTKKSQSDVSGLFHDGTHIVDIVSFLFNDAEVKDISLDKTIVNSEKIRQVNIHYEIGGVPVFLELAGNRKYFGFDLDIRGKFGRIIIGNGYFKLYKRKASRFYTNFYSLTPIRKIKRPSKTCYFSNMVKNGVDFIDKKAAIVSGIDNAMNTIKILEKIKDKLTIL